MKGKITVKTLLFGLVGGLVIVALAYGGYAWWKGRQPEENGENSQQKPKSELVELGNGWNKYINHEYGFSFEVPDFWEKDSIDQNIDNSAVKDIRMYFEKECPNLSPEKCDYLKVIIRKSSIMGAKPIKEWYKDLETDQYIGSPGIIERKKIEIGGKKAWKLKTSFDSVNYTILIFNFEKGYVLDIYIMPNTAINNNIVKKLLDTVQFDF